MAARAAWIAASLAKARLSLAGIGFEIFSMHGRFTCKRKNQFLPNNRRTFIDYVGDDDTRPANNGRIMYKKRADYHPPLRESISIIEN